LYAAPNSLFSHNGAGRWFTHRCLPPLANGQENLAKSSRTARLCWKCDTCLVFSL